ncbi:MAG: DUF503 domain-containing protein [Phycisphaerae bacterium]
MATTLGLLHVEFQVPWARSLKDKRRALRSFRDRTRNKFNVSVAEVGMQDNPRHVVLAVAMVGSDHSYVESALQKIVNTAAMDREMVLLDTEIEWV